MARRRPLASSSGRTERDRSQTDPAEDDPADRDTTERDRAEAGSIQAGQPGQASHTVVRYPGGIRARYSWGNSGRAAEVFALSTAGPRLVDLGSIVSADPDSLCRAEVELQTPTGATAFRLASLVYAEPAGLYWDTTGLLVVGYGFVTYALDPRAGELRWSHRSATPLVAVLGSSQLDHVIVQAQLETFAIDERGQVRWRLALTDVAVAAALVGGVLVIENASGEQQAIDPRSGEARRLEGGRQ